MFYNLSPNQKGERISAERDDLVKNGLLVVRLNPAGVASFTMTDSVSDTETGSDSGSDSNANGVTGNNDSYTDFANGSEHFSLSMNGGSTSAGDTDSFTLTDTSNDSSRQRQRPRGRAGRQHRAGRPRGGDGRGQRWLLRWGQWQRNVNLRRNRAAQRRRH